MTRKEMINILAAYRRPGSPVYAYHFRKLPPAILQKQYVPDLMDILWDESLPTLVREHAAGALGEIGDRRAVGSLVTALIETPIRRGPAIALGRMRAKEAAEVLREFAPRVKAAQWALSQVTSPETSDEAIEDLRSGQLREIGSKVKSLNPRLKQEVAVKVRRQLEIIMSSDEMAHVWMVTTLQYLSPPEAGEVLIEALNQTIRQEEIGNYTRHRIIRAIGAIRPPQAIPALIDVICNIGYMPHKHMAAVCIAKIVKSRGSEAKELLDRYSDQLRDMLSSLNQLIGMTQPRDDRILELTIRAISQLLG